MKSPFWRYLSSHGLVALPQAPPQTSIYTGALPVYINLDEFNALMALPNAGVVNHDRIIAPNTLSL
jgi:hypothetical protein